jgi:TonB family protein
MSAAPSPALDPTPQRGFPRHAINVPLDLIALRSGVPENLPGRCMDLCEAGVGAVVAGELTAGQQVAVELRLPNVGVPVRARALVRYQSRLRCGLEFVGLSVEQREMIRYWVYRSASEAADFTDLRDLKEKSSTRNNFKKEGTAERAEGETPMAAEQPIVRLKRSLRIGRRRFYMLFACMLTLAGLGWWQWQRSWNELETRALVAGSSLRVSPETMEKRVVTKVDPVYPEAARIEKTEGLVVLDALIAPDGSVLRLRPVSGPDLLVQSAKEAVQSWKFEPYLSSGKAVEVETTISVDFRLN